MQEITLELLSPQYENANIVNLVLAVPLENKGVEPVKSANLKSYPE